MDFKGYIFSILIAVLVFVAFGSTLLDMGASDKYNTNISAKFQDTYSDTSDLNDLVSNVTQLGLNLTDKAQDSKNVDWTSDPIKDQYKTIRFIFSSFDIVKTMINSISDVLGLPPILINIAIAMLIFTLAFLFLNSIFKWIT